jgi:fluoride exporter
MSRFLWVCFGGALGTGARYLLSGWSLRVLGAMFPSGTLAVNVIGSFLIAMLMHVGTTTQLIPPTVRIFLTTGILGGFTTYSSFNYETFSYFRTGAWALGGLYLSVTVLGCMFAGLLGFAAGRVLVGN